MNNIKGISSLPKSRRTDSPSTILESAANMEIICDMSGRVLQCNGYAERLLGYSENDMVGRSLHHDFFSPESWIAFVCKLSEISKTGGFKPYQYDIFRQNGSVVHVLLNIGILYGKEYAPIGLSLIGINSFDAMNAFFSQDKLDKLSCGEMLEGQLKCCLAQYWEEKQSPVILYIGIDDFEIISNNIKIFRRRLLKIAGCFLQDFIGSDGKVFMLDSEQLAIMVFHRSNTEEIIMISNKIIQQTQKLWLLSGLNLSIAVSVKILLDPDSKSHIYILSQKVEIPMQSIKRWQLDISNLTITKPDLRNCIEQAIQKKDMAVYYQPQFILSSGWISGTEALIRWNHPVDGMVLPAEFIPFAEGSGTVMAIDEYVLYTACAQNKKWHDIGYRPTSIAVNLSVQHFQDRCFVKKVKNILNDTGMAGEWLELEITERELIKDILNTMDILFQLKNIGIKIVLDDFGTGYSSLNYLKTLPIDTIKLGQNFIKNITQNAQEEIVVEKMINLAHALNLEVVAEGVETKEQLELLKRYQCDKVQGYLYSKPDCAHVIENMLRRNSGR